MDKIVIFRPNIELEAIARQSVEASREVDCAYFGNIGRNSGYFLLPIFLSSYLIIQPSEELYSQYRQWPGSLVVRKMVNTADI